jgi:hypothetical protein
MTPEEEAIKWGTLFQTFAEQNGAAAQTFTLPPVKEDAEEEEEEEEGEQEGGEADGANGEETAVEDEVGAAEGQQEKEKGEE